MKMKGTLEELIKDWPKPSKVKVTQDGFNFTYRNRTYSFYYNNKPVRPAKIVVDGKSYSFTPGNEISLLRNTFGDFKNYDIRSDDQIQRTEDSKHYGAHACIEHVKRKIDLIKLDTTRKNNQLLLILQQLTDEFKQYL